MYNRNGISEVGGRLVQASTIIAVGLATMAFYVVVSKFPQTLSDKKTEVAQNSDNINTKLQNVVNNI